jgi:hypothetical protein
LNALHKLSIAAVALVRTAVYNQMESTFQNQGCQMDVRVSGYKLPVALLDVVSIIIILVLLPVFDGYIYPQITRLQALRASRSSITVAAHPQPTMLAKMGAGFLFAVAAMVVAGQSLTLAGAQHSHRPLIATHFTFGIRTLHDAGLIEIVRKQHIPAQGTPGAAISYCKDASDYSLTRFQTYFESGNASDKPRECR